VSGTEDFWDDVLGYLGEGKLVPFVGPDLLTLPTAGGPKTLWNLMAERMAQRLRLAGQWTGRSPLNDVVHAFLASHDRTEVDRLYRQANELLHEIAPQPSESLRQLAAIRDIGLFVSTTFDSLLAQALNAVRFGGEPLTRELWFAPSQSTAEQQANTRPPASDETVVFKLFGRVSSIPQYVLHEEDLLEWLHALLSETARLPEWLASLLKNQPLLFIGCRVSDWVGRFVVRMASSTRLSLAPKQLFIVGAAGVGEASLTDFLQTYCGTTRVEVIPSNPAEFVAELHRRWTLRKPERLQPAPPPTPRGSIFISYAREDVEAARRLRDAIERLGGDAWLDESRLLPGDAWEEEILRAIRRKVRLMIAVVSQNTELREEGYVFREWRQGIERAQGILKRRFVVPAVVDVAYGGHPEQYRRVPEGFSDLHYGHAPAGEPDQQLTHMLQEEIRAMWREGSR
jgi:hypothetical protein